MNSARTRINARPRRPYLRRLYANAALSSARRSDTADADAPMRMPSSCFPTRACAQHRRPPGNHASPARSAAPFLSPSDAVAGRRITRLSGLTHVQRLRRAPDGVPAGHVDPAGLSFSARAPECTWGTHEAAGSPALSPAHSAFARATIAEG